METRGSKAMAAQKTVKNGRRSNRERKIALIQDVCEPSSYEIPFILSTKYLLIQ